jgi:5-oxoprolinase (ATP-hydrolysing)
MRGADQESSTNAWQFWVDRGGTFTDIVALRPDGTLTTVKLLSENPERYADAAVHGILGLLTNTHADTAHIAAVKMGTTVATNALLERDGAQTVLIITEGLGDALRIGYQNRPDIFALDIRLPAMLYSHIVEAEERVSAGGDIVRPLNTRRLEEELERARAAGCTSAAIVLMHGYRYPAHEQSAAEIARRVGFEQVSVSHIASPLMKIVSRGDTTLVDAYLSPVLERYVSHVRDGLESVIGTAPLLFMQSHGGLARADHFHGKDSILSGPAGGVVGMVETARTAGYARTIGFDMGGTSTDVSLYEGDFERADESSIAGFRITAPMMHIHTVAAGGGSILKYRQARLQVGPESAGADPGPACYGRDGPLTITDANVQLGRIQPDFFPAVFGPCGDAPINASIVAERFDALTAAVNAEANEPMSAEQVAAGFLHIAVERMANAIKQISIQRGHDVTRFVLSCFGGAGGQHACQVADALGIQTVMIHPLAGVLSAYGMGLADIRSLRARTIEVELDAESLAQLEPELVVLEQEMRDELLEQGLGEAQLQFERRLKIKLAGSDATLTIPWARAERTLRSRFHDAHRKQFGFETPGGVLIIDSIELEGVGVVDKPAPANAPQPRDKLAPLCLRPVWFGNERVQTPIYAREDLPAGIAVHGPAVVVESNGTIVIEPGWQTEVNSVGDMILSRHEALTHRESVGVQVDPIMLEVFNNLFMHIAEQMGVVLQHTAHSVNIKERLDFSCAVFDADGGLIANAPHMPVHLGSMGESVRAVLDQNRSAMKPGDIYMLNAPYNGGTHLPDITVVAPVFGPRDRDLSFTVACRAHHADVGGIMPGSMPAASRSIHEEGVLLDNVLLVRDGQLREREIRELFEGGPDPARNVEQNIADLSAQIAATAKGIAELERIVDRFGLDVVHAYMIHIKNNAEQCVRNAIEKLRSGRWTGELDSGERIEISVVVDSATRSAVVDFTGTSPTSTSNFNAPAAIARAAVLYVFRTLVDESIPLNEGCLEPIEIRLPARSLVNPEYPASVVAGNVETSQCITDTLLAALGACAASQGTMNNLTFGNERYQYYETICGGAGAGPTFDGASAVHTHMTNSRLTDPEVLEWRYPIRIERFAVRRGSGGDGSHRGGDGVIREIVFLEPMQAAILSSRRHVGPFGLAGGADGLPGRNRVVRASGDVETLGGTAEVELNAGDRLVIETPGGGGYGNG